MRCCRSPVDGEDNIAGLCCHLEEQVRTLHTGVCEALQRKYSSVLRSDDHTAHLSHDVVIQFSLVKPLFEHLEKVWVVNDFLCADSYFYSAYSAFSALMLLVG